MEFQSEVQISGIATNSNKSHTAQAVTKGNATENRRTIAFN